MLTVKDGAGNLTTLSYDGYDRLSEVEFPMPTTGSGSSNPSDYESYGYDNNGNLTSKRLRSGQTVTLTYDALNRLTQETFPSGASLPVYYAYDLMNRVLMVSNISASGPGIAYAYDALGRATSMTQNGKTLTYAYDAAGNRTGVTWPDTSNPLTANYVYDPLNHVTQIEQNGATSGSGLLAAYSYDGAGRRTAVSRAGGAGLATSYSYDGISRLSTLGQTLSSSAGTTFTYGYNPASQVISRADSNGGLTVRPSAISSTYTANGLNQYSTITGVEQTVAAGPQAALTYDPLGRIQAETSSGATSNFLYDGAFLAEEYSASGATTARYVPGPGTDEPIVVYSGAGLSSPGWYAADEEGSIIATADASANDTASYAYGPYGEPITSAGAPAWGGARYRYTGQIEIPGALSYFYKARMYDPSQGRFFQTDPAGFGGGINIYAYVTDDPINGSDPKGREAVGLVVGLVYGGVNGFLVSAFTPKSNIGTDLISAVAGAVAGGIAGGVTDNFGLVNGSSSAAATLAADILSGQKFNSEALVNAEVAKVGLTFALGAATGAAGAKIVAVAGPLATKAASIGTRAIIFNASNISVLGPSLLGGAIIGTVTAPPDTLTTPEITVIAQPGPSPGEITPVAFVDPNTGTLITIDPNPILTPIPIIVPDPAVGP